MMDERERRNIMTRAIQHFGETAQIDMAVEEMAELTKAICKVKRAQAGAEMGAAVENVVEEIADVQIMLGYQPPILIKPVIALNKEARSAVLEELKIVPTSTDYIAITVNMEGGADHE